jgi:hypothetical protein
MLPHGLPACPGKSLLKIGFGGVETLSRYPVARLDGSQGLFANAALALPVASQTTFMPAITAALEVRGDLQRPLIVASVFFSF